MARRWCAPLRWHGLFLGVLMVIDADATLSPADHTVVQTCAADISALLFRDGADGDRLDTAVGDALSNEPDRRSAGLAALRDDDTFRDAGPCSVTTVRVLDGVDPIRVEAVLRSVLDIVTRSRTTTVAYRVHGVVAAVLQTGPSDPAIEIELAKAISERASTTLSGARVVCGLGSSRPGISAAWESLRDSEVAADAAARVPGLGDTCRYDEVGAYAVLLRLPESALTRALLPTQLTTLIAGDPGGTLTETLAVYLANAGNSPRTAGALHVHRTSLYYRLGRIRELTGADLDDGNVRLSLQLGLALLSLIDDDV